MLTLNPAILAPVFALAGWTFLVLLLIGVTRVGASLRGAIHTDDFRLGESARVPEWVRLPNRNYMNLLELPVLFYVVCLLLYVSGPASASTLPLAWTYVALRMVHTVIHLTYNHVLHRFAAFALSNVTLLVLWGLTGRDLLARAGV
jgi:hypothetical protein